MNADLIGQFRDAIRGAGLNAPDEIVADGRLHRFATNGKRTDDAGWYIVFADGVPAGRFGCWRSDIDETWSATPEQQLSSADREKLRRSAEAAKRARDADLERRRADAAKRAKEIWDASTPATAEHPYLKAKNIEPHGVRTYKGALVLPVVDAATSTLMSLEFIGVDGGKRFLTGGRTAGGCFQIGEIGNVVLVAEGFGTAATLNEATGYAVVVAFSAGNLLPVAKALREQFADAALVVCADNDAATEGNPGLTAATAAAQETGALLAVPDAAGDFNDLQQAHGLSAVREVIERVLAERSRHSLRVPTREEIRKTEQAEFERLAELSVSQYEREREAAAKRLEIRVSVLDREVAAARKRLKSAELAGTMIEFKDPQPWSKPVNGAALLDEIAATLRRYVVLPPHADAAIALWLVVTHLLHVVDVAPILSIASPTHRCGKTTLLGILAELAAKPLATSNIMPAGLFRVVEKYQPTLLIDEGDSFLKMREELRGLLNSGHTRTSAFVLRCVGDDSEPRRFSTWAFKAISAIGTLPTTVADRSVAIDIQRKRPDQRVEKLRHADPKHFQRLAAQLAKWAGDSAAAVKAARTAVPTELHDRAADNWYPLLTVADLAGAEWPDRARRAALELSGATPDGDALVIELLADVRAAFGDKDGCRARNLSTGWSPTRNGHGKNSEGVRG